MLSQTVSEDDPTVFHINVITPEQYEIPYDLPSNATLHTLKTMLSDDLKLPPQDFTLRFCNEILDDSQSLSRILTVNSFLSFDYTHISH